MAGRIIRQQLFDEGEKRELQQTLLEMEEAAVRMIAAQPEKREAVIERLNTAAAKFIRGAVRRKRKEAVLFGAAMFVVGMVFFWIGDAKEWRIVVLFGGSLFISGIGTALVNAVAMLFD